jgi:hypothetical protein
MAARKPPYAGLRRWYKNEVTGGHVGLYDGEAAELDTEAGRWQTVCEDHGSICSHRTFDIARAFATCPEEWCEDCREAEHRCPQCGSTYSVFYAGRERCPCGYVFPNDEKEEER